jgi:very-short-patch-repair endonuclease
MPRPIRSTSKIMRRAGELRRTQTPEEAKLWSRLRNHQLGGIGFRRQHAIGRYIVDFCSPGRKLIIEVDGSQHAEQQEYDNARTDFLESKGYRVIRFSNRDVNRDIEAVLLEIQIAAGIR